MAYAYAGPSESATLALKGMSVGGSVGPVIDRDVNGKIEPRYESEVAPVGLLFSSCLVCAKCMQVRHIRGDRL